MDGLSFAEPLLGLAVVLLAGILGGELVARIRLPRVTGWIGTGILLRAISLPGLDHHALASFSPFTSFVLGFIAFTVGTRLHLASLRNARARLALLLVAEALITPSVVVLALHFVGGLDLDIALILSAVAVCGGTGSTIAVVQEVRSRGLLTRTLLAAVGLIDIIGVGLFIIAIDFANTGTGAPWTWTEAAATIGTELGLALAVGVGAAALALVLIRSVISPAFVGPAIVAVILAAWGGARHLGVSSILACTFAGIAMTNLRHDVARAAEAYLRPFNGVLFVGFYTFAGMHLDLRLVAMMTGLVGLYFAARTVGKCTSSYLAMRISDATSGMRRYLGVALLPHGGVAVGLLLTVPSQPGLNAMSDIVVALGLAALAVNELVGPVATRFALTRTREAGRDRPRLLDFLTEQRIITGLRGTDKRQLIETLADRLYATSSVPIPKGEFLEQVMSREAEESTCLGEGFMIPHAILDAGDDVYGVLGLSKEGIPLGAYDGRNVHCIVLLATPRQNRKRHLQILAAFAAAITRDENLREQLYAARSPAHAYDVLHADEATELNYFLDDEHLQVDLQASAH